MLLVAVGVVATVPVSVAAQDISGEASTFVQALGNQAIQIVTDKTLTFADRERRFHDMFVTSFDVPAIARFVLGRYRRTATDAQKAEFETLFESMIVGTYNDRFSQYKGEPFVVVASRSEEGENNAMVTTSLAQPSRWRSAAQDRLAGVEAAGKPQDRRRDHRGCQHEPDAAAGIRRRHPAQRRPARKPAGDHARARPAADQRRTERESIAIRD
ncbi:MAG: ABC transporter substrate-binding protein [Pseudomonadota bacterium]